MTKKFKIKDIPSGNLVYDSHNNRVGVVLDYCNHFLALLNGKDDHGERIVESYIDRWEVINKLKLYLTKVKEVMSEDIEEDKLYYSQETGEIVRVLGDETFIGRDSYSYSYVPEDKEIIFLSSIHGNRLEVAPDEGYKLIEVEIKDFDVRTCSFKNYNPDIIVEVSEPGPPENPVAYDDVPVGGFFFEKGSDELALKLFQDESPNIKDYILEWGNITALFDGVDWADDVIIKPDVYDLVNMVKSLKLNITYLEEIEGPQELEKTEKAFIPGKNSLLIKADNWESFFKRRNENTAVVIRENHLGLPMLFNQHPDIPIYKVNVEIRSMEMGYNQDETDIRFYFTNSTDNLINEQTLGDLDPGTKIRLKKWAGDDVSITGVVIDPNIINSTNLHFVTPFVIYEVEHGMPYYDFSGVIYPDSYKPASSFEILD